MNENANLVKCFGLNGISSFPVSLECNISNGNPYFDIIGLPDAAIKESKERVRAAILASSIRFPFTRVIVNLAPADVKKAGSLYDLPIAIAILTEMRELPKRKIALIGELSFSGEIRAVKGVLPMIIDAKKHGITDIIIPKGNVGEGRICKDINVYVASHLIDVINHIRDIRKLPLASTFPESEKVSRSLPDMSEVKGQEFAKKAIEIAAAGGHNLIMIGTPGSGKSMLAKRIPSILPPLSYQEQIETTKLFSVSGLLLENQGLVTNRPFRSPHHNISSAALVGGSSPIKPGEISLSHNGVLFLDELPEFQATIIDSLRQPIEDKFVTISRATSKVSFPCDFMLIAAMNPCPCGYHGTGSRCTCSANSIKRYQARISGPIMDRFDIHASVTPVKYSDLSDKESSESSKSILRRVIATREIQAERYKNTNYSTNSQINHSILMEVCELESAAETLLKDSFDKLGLSARGHDKILKLARTIADIEQKKQISKLHIAQAIHLRSGDRN